MLEAWTNGSVNASWDASLNPPEVIVFIALLFTLKLKRFFPALASQATSVR